MGPANAPQDIITKIGTSDGQTVYYLSQEGEDLIEDTDDGDLGVRSGVGVAKPKTDAVYLLPGNEKRAIYCLAEDNTIKDFEWDSETWEWAEGSIGQMAIAAAPDTGFAAITDDEGRREVFFQSPSGLIQSIRAEDGRPWELSSHLPGTRPAMGASLCSLKVGNRVYVFYSHQSCSIHALLFDGEVWKDEPVPASSCDSGITSISARGQGSSYVLQFCDSQGDVFLVSDGKSIKLGTIVNGKLKKDKDAQADRSPDPVDSNPKIKGLKP